MTNSAQRESTQEGNCASVRVSNVNAVLPCTTQIEGNAESVDPLDKQDDGQLILFR